MYNVVGVRFKKAGKIYYFDPAAYILEKDDYVIVETARGVEYGKVVVPIKQVGEIMKDYDTLFVVDTVSSLAGDNVQVDGYGLDICLSGSQKCIEAPPGMAGITVSDDAWNVIDKVNSPTYY